MSVSVKAGHVLKDSPEFEVLTCGLEATASLQIVLDQCNSVLFNTPFHFVT